MSQIVTGVLAGLCIVGVVVLTALGQPVPDALQAALWTTIGAAGGAALPARSAPSPDRPIG